MLRVTAASYREAKECPFRNVLDRVGDKWTFLTLSVLEDGPKRFNEIKRSIGDISQRVLTKDLRDLERDGYLTRTVLAERPPHVIYELTTLGKSLLGPVTKFMTWAIEAYPAIKQARDRYERAHANVVEIPVG